jgi:hypothetical protein
LETRWIEEVQQFADALEDRAAHRSEPFFRAECRADVEYLRKAAQLLKIMSGAYLDLSAQVTLLSNNFEELRSAAHDAIEIIKKQQDLQSL